MKGNILIRCLSLLPLCDRALLAAAAVIQVVLSFLDLLGVAVIGVLGALAVNGVGSKQPGNRVSAVLGYLNLENHSFQYQVGFLGITAGVLLITRTLLSVYFSRRTMYFLSRRGANISASLVAKLLNQPFLKIQERTNQQTIFALTSGVSTITLVVLGGAVSIVSDFSLLVVMILGLVVVDYQLAIGTVILFAAIGLVLYKSLHGRVHNLASREATLNIASNEKISEVLTAYRENVVRGRRSYYAKAIGGYRVELAATQAELSFMPNISKYVIESSLVLGALVLSALQFKLQNATHAVATLAIFLAAGSRIAPAVLRLQQSALAFKGATGSAAPTLELIDSLNGVEELAYQEKALDFEHRGFNSSLIMKEISFTYPKAASAALKDINLEIHEGQTVAIVGPSGSGKTTLVDVILGVLQPNIGNVELSGSTPQDAINKWPGAISYLPQDVFISNGTIAENISLGFPSEQVKSEKITDSASKAQLSQFISTLPEGFETQVGERGAKLSGGQRQRLGIARALFTNPKLLVLDEATSALDGQTEADISSAIHELKGHVTVILIAHRLSTARNADVVVYLNEGKIITTGTFDEVRKAVPDFDRQARLMGL